jgi:predicted choloylglycine hydrolase
MKKITIQGSFYEMGQQYGKQCKKEIRSFTKMSYIMASLSKKPGSQPFNPNMWRFVPTLFTYKKEKSKWQEIAKEYEKEIMKYHPDAIDFIKGIAKGAELPYIDVLALNVSTENIITCSAWGAAGSSTLNNEPLLGMNADEETMASKFYHFLSINPNKGYRYKVTALSGWAGFNHGMNEKGLSWAGTLLWTKPETRKTLRPPMMVLMKVLNTCSTVEEVKTYFESVPNHELGSVYYIADTKKIMHVECSCEKRVYTIIENGSRGNTNLVTSPELQHLNIGHLLKQNLHAYTRSIRMKKLLSQFDGKIDVDIMHLIASDHGEKIDGTHNKSICQHPEGLKYNYKTLINFIAQPREKCFWIYEGNPCKNNVKKYDFNN